MYMYVLQLILLLLLTLLSLAKVSAEQICVAAIAYCTVQNLFSATVLPPRHQHFSTFISTFICIDVSSSV